MGLTGPAARTGLAGLAGLAAVVLLGGCGDADAPAGTGTTTQVAVHGVFGTPDSRDLQLGVDSCNADPVATAEETADEVRLTVTIAGEPSGLECQDATHLTLDEPLGDRGLIDTLTGETLEPRVPEG